MPKFVAFLAGIVAVSAPAMANGCYWVGNQIYCEAGCWVSNRWWDGYREWMQYQCIPSDLIIAGVLAAALVIIGAIVAAINSSSQTTALTEVTAEEDARAEEAQRITDNLKSARAEADHFLETYRRR
ncbi:MAG: hypothetical protein AB7G08_28290 [Hyphomicrobiaceae bacterium]